MDAGHPTRRGHPHRSSGELAVRPRHVYPMALYTRSPGDRRRLRLVPTEGAAERTQHGLLGAADDADLARGCTAMRADTLR
jgi:hypothetical protein